MDGKGNNMSDKDFYIIVEELAKRAIKDAKYKGKDKILLDYKKKAIEWLNYNSFFKDKLKNMY